MRTAEALTPLSADEERQVLDKAAEVAAGDKKTLFWLPEVRAAG